MRTLFLALILALTALLAACGDEAPSEFPADAVFLDVRTPDEYDAGHVDGARNIDFYAPDFADQLAELPRDATYVVYCQSGNRSGQAKTAMDELGFTDVIDGGAYSSLS
ncbi:rhodanese-like domain-containing protein [Tessaracoccus sp. Y36]